MANASEKPTAELKGVAATMTGADPGKLVFVPLSVSADVRADLGKLSDEQAMSVAQRAVADMDARLALFQIRSEPLESLSLIKGPLPDDVKTFVNPAVAELMHHVTSDDSWAMCAKLKDGGHVHIHVESPAI